MSMERRISVSAGSALGLALVAFAATGCATKGFVKTEVAGAKSYTDTRVGEVQSEVDRASARADEAWEKATLAERLAAGRLDYDVVATHQVQFAFDDYRLDDGAQVVLDDLGGKLPSHPRYVLEIRGFADATGPDRYNFKLGRERAESVQRYLMTRHTVPATRIAIVSFGEENPIADNDSRLGRAENRRVQVRLLDVKPQMEPMALGE